MEQKKAQLAMGDLKNIVIVVVTVGLVAAFGLQIMGDIQDDMTASSAEYNATGQGITAVAKVPAKLGTIVTVLLAGIIIFFLVRGLSSAA